MKLINILLFFVFFCCGPTIVSAQYISVDDTQTAIALVNILTSNSACSNAPGEKKINGDTFTPGKNSYGTFSYTGSNFPFTKGIVLSTSSSIYSEGPYFKELSSNPNRGSLNWKGDTDLETALTINSTINATFLEFDFVPLTNSISFNYIFASNEYLSNFSCEYSDGFAFLIKERDTPGSIYKNLAVIPGTTIPVSSMNIHPRLIPSSSAGSQLECDAINETYFNGYNSSTSPINYTGQTKVMNAQTSVIAGRTYHIKLVIADHRNEYFNSAVFLEAGSFSPQVDLGPDLLITNDNAICFGESHLIDTKLTASTNTYKWFKDGSPTPILGAEGPSYLVSDAGTYTVEVAFSSATCTASDDIKIEFYPEISLTDTTLTQCDNNGNGVAIFDLTKADNTIKNNDATLITVVYYESLADAKGKINSIPNPSSYTYKPAIPIVYARVTNTKGCADYAELKLFISNKTIAPQDPILSCDGDKQDGLYHFDLEAEVSPQVVYGLPLGLQVEYYLNISDAMTQKNELPNIFNNTIPNEQIIFARIVNGADCYKITPITLVVSAFDPLLFQDELATMCEESSKQLSVSTGYTSYLWTTEANSNTITVTSPGEYSVTVTDENGCEITKKFTVNISQIATITGVTVNDFAGKENSVLIQYTGNSSYEFSIDGFNFQDDPLFEGVAPASYYATARDKNGCGLSELFQFYVMDYPRFFTPNGDNYNDVWEIKNINIYPNFSLSIFDRYGKLLQQLNSANPSWNGTFNGNSLPATDYWFDLKLEEDKIIKGHFSLKR